MSYNKTQNNGGNQHPQKDNQPKKEKDRYKEKSDIEIMAMKFQDLATARNMSLSDERAMELAKKFCEEKFNLEISKVKEAVDTLKQFNSPNDLRKKLNSLGVMS